MQICTVIKRFLIISVLIALNSACSTSSLKTEIDIDPEASFSGLNSFNWLAVNIELSEGSDAEKIERTKQLIKTKVNQELIAKGYRQDSQLADFLVAVQVVVTDKSEVTVMNDAYQYPMGWGYGRRYTLGAPNRPRKFVYVYKQGTLIIDMISASTKKLMWRGSAVDEVEGKKTEQQKRQIVIEAVQAILKEFPPD